ASALRVRVRAGALTAWARTRDLLVSRLVSVLLVGALLGGALFSVGATGQQLRTGGGGKLCLATNLPTSGEWAWAGKPAENAVNLAVQQHQSLGHGFVLAVSNFDDRGPHQR